MNGTRDARFYQIHVKGHMGDQLRPWFENMIITNLENGEALLSGLVVDQAALHGLLNKIRDLGIPILAVNSAFRSLAMNILAINGSPRGKKGNTERILQPFLEGARETGAITEIVYLRDKKIHYCSGCFTCWTKTPGVCAHRDDMPELLDKIRQADILVYATPLYSYSVTGLMKTYLDRNLPLALPYMIKEGNQYVHPMRHPEAWPKKLVVISTCGFPEPHHFSGLVEMFHRLTSRPALELAGMILCPGGEMLRQPQMQELFKWYLDATHRAGREVCELGSVTPDTQAILRRPLMPDTDTFTKWGNAHWDQIIAHLNDVE